VARATGETVGRVHQIGFTLVVVPPHRCPDGVPPEMTARPSASPKLAGRPSTGMRRMLDGTWGSVPAIGRATPTPNER
jgi:hypothetical protein